MTLSEVFISRVRNSDTHSLCAFCLWSPDRTLPKGVCVCVCSGTNEADCGMNSWQGTGCWRRKGHWSLCVKEQERAADIQAYLSLSLLAFESEWQRGAGQSSLSEHFCLFQTMGSCLIQICYLSVTFTHRYFNIFVCALSPAQIQLTDLHINVRMCLCYRIGISSLVELSQMPLFHGILPPSTSHWSSEANR